VSDIISKVVFGQFCLLVPDLGPTTRQKFLLKFLLETRLKSASFETLINFLAFLVQKL